MHSSDQMKVIQAGFTILRASDYPCICIKYLQDGKSWKIKERFETKAARDIEVKRCIDSERMMIFD